MRYTNRYLPTLPSVKFKLCTKYCCSLLLDTVYNNSAEYMTLENMEKMPMLVLLILGLFITCYMCTTQTSSDCDDPFRSLTSLTCKSELDMCYKYRHERDGQLILSLSFTFNTFYCLPTKIFNMASISKAAL